MRSLYEQTASDTETLFRNANERFAEAVQGMKQMAAEMQSELDATRSELRRGVFELPQETAENAAQMRRVIVDQIEALAELNRIVARHGRNLDAVEPVRRTREEPTLAVVTNRSESYVTQRNAADRVMRSSRALRHEPRPVALRRDAPSHRRSRPRRISTRAWLADRSAQPRVARGE